MTTGYKQLTLDDRVQIEKLLDQDHRQAEIARRVGVHPSTISRELKSRSWRPGNTSAAYTPYRPAGLRSGPLTGRHYRATRAQEHAKTCRARSHQARRMVRDRLVDYVITRLRRGWTPAEIAGRLPIDFPDDERMRVSVETLYAWIYHRSQSHRRLWEYLPRGQHKRRRRGGRRVHHERIEWRTSIHTRPPQVEDRIEFGHWESDSVLGARGTGVLHTTVERVSRYVCAVRLPAATAQATVQAQIALYSPLPAHAVCSVTTDNGTEFTLHHVLADTLGVPTYFADPYSAWQRGTNEHFNGRIRKYLPKGTSFADLSQDELDEFITEINNRPRKVLGWHTPDEVFHQLSSTPTTPRCTST